MLRKLWAIAWRQHFRNLAIGIDCLQLGVLFNYSLLISCCSCNRQLLWHKQISLGSVVPLAMFCNLLLPTWNFFISLQNYHYGIFALTHWGPHLYQCIVGLSFLSFYIFISTVFFSYIFIYFYPMFSFFSCYLLIFTVTWIWGTFALAHWGMGISRHTSELYVSKVNAHMKWETKVDHLGNWQYLISEKGFFRKENPKSGVLGTQCVFGQGGKKQSVTVCPAHTAV